MDEAGDIKLVILGAGEYGRVKGKESGRSRQLESGDKNQAETIPDPDAVNREITQAQLEEVAQGGGPKQQSYLSTATPQVKTNAEPKRDMREEVIDPSFDFDAPEDI